MPQIWGVAPDATSSSGSRLAEEGCEARIHQPIVLRSPVEVIRLSRCGFLACHAQASERQPLDRGLVCLRPAISHAGPYGGGVNEIVASPLKRKCNALGLISAL